MNENLYRKNIENDKIDIVCIRCLLDHDVVFFLQVCYFFPRFSKDFLAPGDINPEVLH